MPKEVRDKRSGAWNGGRIHYIGAAEGVVEAYEGRFAADMERFLKARAEEMVGGGIMVMICLGVSDDVSPSQLPFRILYDNLAFALIDMAKEVLHSFLNLRLQKIYQNNETIYIFFITKFVHLFKNFIIIYK